jgi:hypothetical protein
MREVVVESDADGHERINRLNYELCTLQALREGLRCREIWVEGADKYCNPEDDLPKDCEATVPTTTPPLASRWTLSRSSATSRSGCASPCSD